MLDLTAVAEVRRTVLPGQVLDLRNWNPTLPTGTSGTPDTGVEPQLATYTSPSFQLDAAHNGVARTTHAGGVTTENSTYPRSELREMNGEQRAATHRMPSDTSCSTR